MTEANPRPSSHPPGCPPAACTRETSETPRAPSTLRCTGTPRSPSTPPRTCSMWSRAAPRATSTPAMASTPPSAPWNAKLADLEDAEAAMAFGSGMAAEAATFLSHSRTGDHIVCLGDVYGGTFELLGENLPRLGIDTTFVTASEVERLPDVLTDGTRIMFFETPTNPTLDVFDIAAITAQAHAVGALVAVDNTFATPVNQNPLHHGADRHQIPRRTQRLHRRSRRRTGRAPRPDRRLAQEPQPGHRPRDRLAARPQHSHPRRPCPSPERHPHRGLRVPRRPPARHQGQPPQPRHRRPGHHHQSPDARPRRHAQLPRRRDAATTTAAVVDRLRVFSIAASLGGAESLVTQPTQPPTRASTPPNAPAAASPTAWFACRSVSKTPTTSSPTSPTRLTGNQWGSRQSRRAADPVSCERTVQLLLLYQLSLYCSAYADV